MMSDDPSLAAYDAFMCKSAPDRLQKVLARYELFKKVTDVPGDIVECGVFKGAGLFTWVKLMLLFQPHCESRVIGFDFFGGSSKDGYKRHEDQECVDFHAGGSADPEEIHQRCRSWGFDRLMLVPGDVVETTRDFAKKNLGTRISLLSVDVDNYEGTAAILQNLYPLVSPGGVIVFDEYGLPGYGESDAVDDYFRERNLRLQRIPWANTPSAYMVKERV